MKRHASARGASSLVEAALSALLFGCGTPAAEGGWATVARDDLVTTVEVVGTLVAKDSDTLGPPLVRDTWEYKISSMVPEGVSVKQGDTLLSFDTSELERRLVTKQNERDSAAVELERELSNAALARQNEALGIAESEARLRKAALTVERPVELSGSLELAVAKLDLELAQKELDYQKQKAIATRRQTATDIAALTDRRRHAEENVQQIERDIPRLTLRAPRGGTVIYVSGPNRPKKKVGDAVWWGEKLLEVAALEQMTARGDIDEVDVSRVRVGQSVTLRLEAHADTEYTGRVTSLGSIVERESPENPLRVVRVELELDKAGALRLRPGMRFRGDIEADRVPGVLLLPLDAVALTHGVPVAHVQRATGAEPAHLTLGRRNQTQVEILSGVSEGERVARGASLRPEDSAP